MARRADKEKALKLRALGWSYSQIKAELGVSKSTLSVWLVDFPLSEERIRELRDHSHIRIEKSRVTKALKREARLDSAYKKVSKSIGKLTQKEIEMCGLFLYWAEGTKAAKGVVGFSNTDPAMIKFFLKFLRVKGVLIERVKVRLQLYKDMNEDQEENFWMNELGIPKNNFQKNRIKNSNLLDITYKRGFGHGTCTLIVYDINLYDELMMGIKYFSLN